MTLPLELGAIQDAYIRRAFEQIAQQFPDPPNLAAAFTTWKPIFVASAGVPTAGAGGTFLIPGGDSPTGALVGAVAGNGTATYAFYLDPADFTANTRTTKLRIDWRCHINATAPATNFAPGLYPVSGFTAPAGPGLPGINTLGTVVSGSSVTFTTPAIGSATRTLSSEFTFPAAGYYCFGVVIGGAMAAGSTAIINGTMQMRQV